MLRGGGIILDYTLRICGIKVRKTKNYKKLLRFHHIYPNLWFQDSIPTLKETSSTERIIHLTQGLDRFNLSYHFTHIRGRRTPFEVIFCSFKKRGGSIRFATK